MFTSLLQYSNRLSVIVHNKQQVMTSEHYTALHGVPVYQMKQVHGNSVHIVNENTPNFVEADAICTNSTKVALSVRFADCQNLVLYDPVHHCVAVIHAGYKGLIAKVITQCIGTMCTKYGSQPQDVIVYSTASLQSECAEFTDPILELPGIDSKFFSGRYANLVAIANDELIQNGVLPQNIALSTECTKCNTHQWYSYRGEQAVKEYGYRNMVFVRLLPLNS
jgi:polyphenol oxidase